MKYLGPYLWRKLPIALRALTEIDKFKKKIRKSDLAGRLTKDKCGSEGTLCSSSYFVYIYIFLLTDIILVYCCT